MKKLLFITILAAAGLTSCKKFLEERSLSDMTPTKVADFGDILHSEAYPASSGNDRLFPMLYLMDDDVETYPSDNPGEVAQFISNAPAFTWQADFIEACKLASSNSVEIFNVYTSTYVRLLKVNVVLQGIDKASGDANERDWIKGQAYGLRAYYYFNLVNLYSLPYKNALAAPDKALGVPLRLDGNVIEEEIPRSTVKEVFAQIRKDLDSSIRLLEKEKRQRNNFFFTDVVAHFLASRVALYMEDWEAAVNHANYVINAHPQLMDFNTANTATLVSNKGVESIWVSASQKEVDNTGFLAYFDVSHSLHDAFEPTDQRLQQFIMETPPELKWFIFSDFIQSKLLDNTDYICFRSAEAYLNRAEANIQLYKNGDGAAAQKALDDLNILRAKRFSAADFQPWAIQPADQMLKACREERRRELFFEGHRWFDLRRYGMPPIQHILRRAPGMAEIYELKENDLQYVLPIPRDVMERNRALVQNPQITSIRLPK